MSEDGGIKEVDKLPLLPNDPLLSLGQGCRLWIGNLDSRVTELSMLKIAQKYGSLDKFDFIYHKKGPDAGKPRGYCFATYSSVEVAEKARKALDGKVALSRKLVVRYANADRQSEFLGRMTASSTKKSDMTSTHPATVLSKEAQIREIEAKLKHMEKTEDKGPLASKRPQPSWRRFPQGSGSHHRSQSGTGRPGPYVRSQRPDHSHSRDKRR